MGFRRGQDVPGLLDCLCLKRHVMPWLKQTLYLTHTHVEQPNTVTGEAKRCRCVVKTHKYTQTEAVAGNGVG